MKSFKKYLFGRPQYGTEISDHLTHTQFALEQ